MPKKTKPKTEKQDLTIKPEQRAEKATQRLRSLAKPGNETQLFRLLAMQTPAKEPKGKEDDK